MELLWSPHTSVRLKLLRPVPPRGGPARPGQVERLMRAGASPSRADEQDRAYEIALIRRAQRGDREAFDALMDLYRERIVRMALHMVGNMEDAQDLCQETFIRVYRALETYDPRRAFSPWLYRIAHNAVLDHLRRKKARPTLSEPDLAQPFEEAPDPTAENPQRTVMSKEIYREVREAIHSLPDNYRSVMVLRFLEDLSYAEIAESLDLTEANVMMRISRARRMLRDKLKHLQTGDGRHD